MPRVPQNMCKRAIGMLQAGMRTVEIARQLGTSARTIRRLRERFNTTGKTKDRPRSGRPRVTTARCQRSLHSDDTFAGQILNCVCDCTEHTRHSQQSNKWPNCD